MGKVFSEIRDEDCQFIEQQKVYFVATVAPQARINLSPKGLDTLRVVSPNEVLWLNLTGSGNETAAHLLEDSRMTLMFCAFEGTPRIYRLYGTATTIHPRDDAWASAIALFPEYTSARQVIRMSVDRAQISCGFGVPLYSTGSERTMLHEWSERKGKQGVVDYWKRANVESIDGKPTGILPIPECP